MTEYTKCKSEHKHQRLQWVCLECGKLYNLRKNEKLKLLREPK